MDFFFKDNLKKKKKLLKAIIFLKLNANSATSGPPIGAILGQYGIPAALFCKKFNDRTSDILSNVELKVMIYLSISGDYIFNIFPPTISFFFKRALDVKKFNSRPGYINFNMKSFNSSKNIIVTPFIIYEILLYNYNKTVGLEYISYYNIKKVIGNLKSMGIHIKI